MQPNILLIEDDADLAALMAHDLGERGNAVHRVASAEDGLRALGEHDFDVVLTDLSLGGMNGVELCSHVHRERPSVPVVVMTAHGTLDTAIAAIRAGAYDYVTKPFELPQLALVVDRAIGLRSLRRELTRLRETAGDADATYGIVGRSPAIDCVRELVQRVADTDATVLVTGESGTGKELVAKALHDASSRSPHPFVAVNCAAMPESLLESELFGHSRGAFTDAKTSRMGLFARANHGTVFLDEIGEMPLGMQAKLLRAIQERKVRPVGSDEEIGFDARIVAATHRNLQAEVAEKRFREDLYYRINVMQIHAPPLRARGSDTLLLAQRFVEQCAAQAKRPVRGISAGVAQQLLAFPWPGNVRQLQNCIERAIAVCRGDELALEDLPDEVRDHHAGRVDEMGVEAASLTALPTMDVLEQRYILKVLRALSGNKTLAAQILGFDRRTLYRKLGRMNAGASADS